MFRSPTTRALALGVIALFHVAIFSDVAMLLCMPVSDAHVATTASHGSSHGSMAAMVGMDHDGMSHAAPAGEPEDGAPLPQHDHGSCNFCCPHGQPDVAALPAFAFRADAPARGIAPVDYVELDLSPTQHLNTLPNPPPVA